MQTFEVRCALWPRALLNQDRMTKKGPTKMGFCKTQGV